MPPHPMPPPIRRRTAVLRRLIQRSFPRPTGRTRTPTLVVTTVIRAARTTTMADVRLVTRTGSYLSNSQHNTLSALQLIKGANAKISYRALMTVSSLCRRSRHKSTMQPSITATMRSERHPSYTIAYVIQPLRFHGTTTLRGQCSGK
jgi:hypothetical protein